VPDFAWECQTPRHERTASDRETERLRCLTASQPRDDRLTKARLMIPQPHDQEDRDDDRKPAERDVDDASEDSFPASDPPSFGSAEPGVAADPDD
jgi:hypothetical protein